jgi:hypothetical protein
MFDCLVWYYGGIAIILLQEVCQEFKVQEIQLNPYDPCVANKKVDGEQTTDGLHVDDHKISHVVPTVVDVTIKWLRSEYENVFKDEMRKMKVYCGKTHKYLGMSLGFSHATMVDYLDEIVVAYDKVLSELSDGFSAVKKEEIVARTSIAPDYLFFVDEDAEKLSEEGLTTW